MRIDIRFGFLKTIIETVFVVILIIAIMKTPLKSILRFLDVTSGIFYSQEVGDMFIFISSIVAFFYMLLVINNVKHTNLLFDTNGFSINMRKNVISVPFNKIKKIKVNRNIIDRLLRTGTLEIKTEHDTIFLEELKEDNINEIIDRTNSSSPSPIYP